MIRIPDSKQRHMALDREIEQSRSHKEAVLRDRYVLDHVSERNRPDAMDETQASRDRMRALAVLMPTAEESRKIEQREELEKIMEENRVMRQALEASLTCTRF